MEDRLNEMSQKFIEEGFCFSEYQVKQFHLFYKMLIEKNKVMNLTSIIEFDEVLEKHFLDSLFLNRAVDLNASLFVLDLGTGAGFPGIPLKIAFPELKIVLMDSVKKKISFLEEVISELNLKSIEAVHARAEEMANTSYREKFDLCVSRAVANLSTLEEYCLPFVKTGGKFVAYKSGNIEKEKEESEKACNLLGGRLKEVYKFDMGENKRSFVIVEKIKTTPKRFPRKAGTPSKEPLR